MKREDARAAALQLLYGVMLGGERGPFDDDTLVSLLGVVPDGSARQYIERTLSGVLQSAEELDARIANHLRNWKVERLARVDLAILRIAAYEVLLREDVPDAVAINEAVKLAHRFSTDEAPAFINGVLGGLAREKERQNDDGLLGD